MHRLGGAGLAKPDRYVIKGHPRPCTRSSGRPVDSPVNSAYNHRSSLRAVIPAQMSAPVDSNRPLSEKYIQDCFHSYLRSSLTQAKAERILDVDVLSSAEGDLMITGTFHICFRTILQLILALRAGFMPVLCCT
jgi:hypothetical protein